MCRDLACYGSLDVGGELECDDRTRIQIDGLSGSRVTGRSRLAFLADKGPKAAKLDRIAFGEGFGNDVEELFDDGAHLAFHDACRTGDILNQILFCCVCHVSNIRSFA